MISGVEERLVLIGEFGRAHGIKGEVRLKSYTADPLAIGRYGPLDGEDGRLVVLTGVRAASGPPGEILVATVEGVAGRDAAEALARLKLYVPRERLPPPGEDEFYLADLVGLLVDDKVGQRLGTVAAVHNFGAGDMLDIAPAAGGKTIMVPFTKAFVPTVDPAGGRIVVTGLPDEAPEKP